MNVHFILYYQQSIKLSIFYCSYPAASYGNVLLVVTVPLVILTVLIIAFSVLFYPSPWQVIELKMDLAACLIISIGPREKNEHSGVQLVSRYNASGMVVLFFFYLLMKKYLYTLHQYSTLVIYLITHMIFAST